jgi:hypothetical protein
VISLSVTELPAIVVGFFNPGGGAMEQAEQVSMGNQATIGRVANLVVSAIVRDDEEFLDDTLEALAEQIETHITDTHGGRAKLTILESTEKEFSEIDDIPVAAITLNFRITYHTTSHYPSSPL